MRNSPIHAQVRVTTRLGPLGEVGIDALAVDHQRREQAHVLALVIAQQLRCNALGTLRLDRRTVLHAMLQTEFDVQQPQEVPHLGGGGDGALAAPRATAAARSPRWAECRTPASTSGRPAGCTMLRA